MQPKLMTRNELNLTTQKVALDAEVGESTYKRLEAGDGNPRLDTLVKIVKCLKTDLNSVVPQEHLCKDAGIWQIVRKLLSMDKKKTQLVSNESDMTPEQYERLVRFTEDASMEEKQEILCKLEQSGDLTLDEQTLKEIMKIKDAVEKKREYGIL